MSHCIGTNHLQAAFSACQAQQDEIVDAIKHEVGVSSLFAAIQNVQHTPEFTAGLSGLQVQRSPMPVQTSDESPGDSIPPHGPITTKHCSLLINTYAALQYICCNVVCFVRYKHSSMMRSSYHKYASGSQCGSGLMQTLVVRYC